MITSSVHSDLKWFAVYTHSRAEKKVNERAMNAGFETFLPLVTKVQQWSDRKKKVEVPLINSYVFVHTSKNNLNTILNIPGVLNILKYLGKPAIVKDVEIANLKVVVNAEDVEINVIGSMDLTKGENVEVLKGPFAGLLAKCIDFAGKHRVIIELEALRSCIEVNLPLNSIRKI